MGGALSGRRAAAALLFATAFLAVVAINSGVNAGCPFLEMQGKNGIRFPRRTRAGRLCPLDPIEGAC